MSTIRLLHLSILAPALAILLFSASSSDTAVAQSINIEEAQASESYNVTPDAMSGCSAYSSYTTYYNGSGDWKPIIYIWGLPRRNGTEDTTGIGIYYWDEIGGWIQVSVSSQWGIQTVAQHRYQQWVGYYIAQRWYRLHWRWNDDWRWRVYICR